MKRILQRIWFWIPFGCICCVILSLLAFATEEVRQVPKLQKRLDALSNTVDPIHLTMTNSGWDLLTNIVMPHNLSNYWAEEIIIEWVTTDDWLLGKQLGLRSDGVVVWREKK